jgi:hypothetical protein
VALHVAELGSTGASAGMQARTMKKPLMTKMESAMVRVCALPAAQRISRRAKSLPTHASTLATLGWAVMPFSLVHPSAQSVDYKQERRGILGPRCDRFLPLPACFPGSAPARSNTIVAWLRRLSRW